MCLHFFIITINQKIECNYIAIPILPEKLLDYISCRRKYIEERKQKNKEELIIKKESINRKCKRSFYLTPSNNNSLVYVHYVEFSLSPVLLKAAPTDSGSYYKYFVFLEVCFMANYVVNFKESFMKC